MTQPMTDQGAPGAPLDLRPIQERCEKATSGRWFHFWPERSMTDRHRNEIRCEGPIRLEYKAENGAIAFDRWAIAEISEVRHFNTSHDRNGLAQRAAYDAARADGEFIAHAREDVPALLAEIEALRADCARLRDALAGQQWQPIETAPKDGTRIIGGDLLMGFVRVTWWDEPHEVWAQFYVSPPTLWQPLPALPAAPQEPKS